MDTDRTRELFAPLIQRPTLTDQLLQRPPFKFLHDIVRETIQTSGYLKGLFTDDELDSAKAGLSRDTKVAFLQKLIDALNIDGHLDNVKPAKIVAGKEPELTNLMLQSLASEAAMAVEQEKREKRSSKTKPKTSEEKKKKESKENSSKSKERSEKSKSKGESKTGSTSTEKKSNKSEDGTGTKGEGKSTSKEKEKKKKRDSASKIKSPVKEEELQSRSPLLIMQRQPDTALYQTALPDNRTPDRESSGGTSKGGDDSGIAEETGAESEQHSSERYGAQSAFALNGRQVEDFSSRINGTSDFVEIHPSTSSPIPMLPMVRPGTAIGRPQTAIGRPGTAVARMAPPKPKKNIIASNINEEREKVPHPNEGYSLILDTVNVKGGNAENFLVEEDEEQLLVDAGLMSQVANINKLQEGDEHGLLVNKIVENTRELEKEQLQEYSPFVEGDAIDKHEQHRIRSEIESVQRALQRATQNVQPLVRTLEFVADDFEAMLRELEDCRKQTAILERQLQERGLNVNAQAVQLASTLRSLDAEIRDMREQVAKTSASIMRNERKNSALLLAATSTNAN